MAAAAALANIDLLERDRLIERVRDDVGPVFQRRLQDLADHPAVGEVRGFGLIGAIELLPRGGRTARELPPTLGLRGASLAREEGVIVRGIRDLVAISPPFVIRHDEIDRLFAAIGRMLDRLWA